MFKLIVNEPWEFGTINGVGPFEVVLRKGVRDNWLIIFNVSIKFENGHTKYLLAKTQKSLVKLNLLEERFERLSLEMAVIENLNEGNFKDYDLDDCRRGFLTGEVSKV